MGAGQSRSQPSDQQQVYISGIHAAYPPHAVNEEFLEGLLSRMGIEDEEIITKLRTVNSRTAIKSRPVILPRDDAFYTSPDPYPIERLTKIWLEHGIPLSTQACLGAVDDWGGSWDDLTHLIAATGSVQCHPGMDAYLARELKLRPDVDQMLLSGVGCAGAIALLRTAYELALAATYKGRPANILVVACDISSLGFRAELEQLKRGNFPIGLTLFSDAAAAAVVSNGLGSNAGRCGKSLFEISHWTSRTVPGTLDCIQLMPTAIGPVSTISKRLPGQIAENLRLMFTDLLASIPQLVGSDGKVYQQASDFDWDIHPGGIGVYDRIIEVMGLTRDNMAATIATYEGWGNSAGPTVLKVLDTRRTLPAKREYIVCCGFGNNVSITIMILRRPR